eukprot:g4496.t1
MSLAFASMLRFQFRKTILDMNAEPKPLAIDESAKVSLSKFRVLDKMMTEVISLIRVHCSDTAKMTASIWDSQSKIFVASNMNMRQLFAENRRLKKASDLLNEEKDKISHHSDATISRLKDQVVLFRTDIRDMTVKSKVSDARQKESEKECDRLRKIVNRGNLRKGDDDISKLADRFENTFEKLDFESRKQMQLLTDLEDEITPGS